MNPLAGGDDSPPVEGVAEPPATETRAPSDAMEVNFVDNQIYGHHADAQARRLREEPLDPRVQTVPANIERAAIDDPALHLSSLVDYLVAGAPSDLARAKRIHDWIADHIDYDAEGFLQGHIGSQAPEDVLRSGSAVCDGYAALFTRMATLAGLRSRKVDGVTKAYTFSRTGQPGRHAWNAVESGGRVYLLDVTADAGYLANDGTFKKQYGTTYLFLAPTAMIYSHFPDDAALQLLDPPKDASQFSALPVLTPAFFRLSVPLPSSLDGGLPPSDTYEIALACPGTLALRAALQAQDGEQSDRRVFAQKHDDVCTLRVAASTTGEQQLAVYARDSQPGVDANYELVLTLRLQFTASYPTSAPFPLPTDAFIDHGVALYSPRQGELVRQAAHTFELDLPGATEAALVATPDCGWTPLSPSGPLGHVALDYEVPAQAKGVVLQARFGAGPWVYLLDYTVR